MQLYMPSTPTNPYSTVQVSGGMATQGQMTPVYNTMKYSKHGLYSPVVSISLSQFLCNICIYCDVSDRSTSPRHGTDGAAADLPPPDAANAPTFHTSPTDARTTGNR